MTSQPNYVTLTNRIHTIVFGNRMCGRLEITTNHFSENTILEYSESAVNEIEHKESRGTLIFSKRTSAAPFFKATLLTTEMNYAFVSSRRQIRSVEFVPTKNGLLLN